MQGGEIIIIIFVALVVFGPKRLPDLAQKLGRWTAELRAAAGDIRRGLENEVADLKVVGDELKKAGDEIKKPLDDLEGALRRHHEEHQRSRACGVDRPKTGLRPDT